MPSANIKGIDSAQARKGNRSSTSTGALKNSAVILRSWPLGAGNVTKHSKKLRRVDQEGLL